MVIPFTFNTLSRADQADLLQAEGIFISSCYEAGLITDRYRLHDFYVDVCYQEATGELVTVRSFSPKQQQQAVYQMPLPRLYIRQGA